MTWSRWESQPFTSCWSYSTRTVTPRSRELVARFEGPIVRELDAVILTDWISESGELL